MKVVPARTWDGRRVMRGVCPGCGRQMAIADNDHYYRQASPDSVECPNCETCDDAATAGTCSRSQLASELREMRAADGRAGAARWRKLVRQGWKGGAA